MRYFRNSSVQISLLIIAALCAPLLASCDKLAPAARKVEQVGKSQYWGYRSDKWEEIDSSYLAAQSYCCGVDTVKDDIRALELFCRAAQSGHKASQIEVARFYTHEAGAGKSTAIPFDRALAYAYYSKAGQDGYEYGAAMRDQLRSKLSTVELERASRLVDAFPDIPCAVIR